MQIQNISISASRYQIVVLTDAREIQQCTRQCTSTRIMLIAHQPANHKHTYKQKHKHTHTYKHIQSRNTLQIKISTKRAKDREMVKTKMRGSKCSLTEGESNSPLGLSTFRRGIKKALNVVCYELFVFLLCNDMCALEA